MFGTMETAAISGFGATRVCVEVDILKGLPTFQVVGLAENSVKEARVRVQSSLMNAGFSFPKGKVTVNLAPADLQKSGTCFDLVIAMALLVATGAIPQERLCGIAAIGELSLTGEIRAVRGMFALAESIKEQGFSILLVAPENGHEAGLVSGLVIKVARTLAEVVHAVVMGDVMGLLPNSSPVVHKNHVPSLPDMEDVIGQEEARRALLIAAAGDHNLVFVGGPGSGKSMMANRLPSLLPPLQYHEAVTLTKIHSLAGQPTSMLMQQRPFRAPHHSITRAGLVGGGSKMIRPGEISLACFGVLFLDELLEFPRAVLEVLRQPLETGCVTISRANQAVTYPAQIALVAAFNPCPCGYVLERGHRCTCAPNAIARYQSRFSGPLADRIDLFVTVPPVKLHLMQGEKLGESSSSMRERVMRARAHQQRRFASLLTNGKMTRRHIKESAELTHEAHHFLVRTAEKLALSARGYDRVIKVARTIADLDDSMTIKAEHVGEALHFRKNAVLNAP